MPYFYNSHTGLFVIESGVLAIPYEAELHLGLGWHEYTTAAQMNKAVKANNWPGPFPGGKGNPTGALGQVSGEAGGTAAAGVGNLTGLNAVGDFFSRLTQPNTWIRVGEVIAGLILLYVGLNALTRDTAAGQAVHRATEGAKKVVEVMPK